MADKHVKSAAEQAADLLDVHVLDMAAQIEALLRGVREVQRGVLRVRGVAVPINEDPVAHVQKQLREMLADCDALRDAIDQARETAQGLAATN